MDILPPLWKHQADAVEEARSRNWLPLFFEPGTGKSRTSIEIIRNICNRERRIPRTIILAPKAVCPQWREEFAKYCPKFPQSEIADLTRMTGAKKAAYLSSPGASKVISFNYEALLTDVFAAALTKFKPEVIILDEIHLCKNPTSKRSKILDKLMNAPGVKTLFRAGLTGTPVLNSPMDLFMIYKLLDGGQTFGTKFIEFRLRYFYDRNAGMPKASYFPDWRPRPNKLDEINEKLARTAKQAKKSECLDLPPLIDQVVSLELPPSIRKVYSEMEKDFLTHILTPDSMDIEEIRSVSFAEFAITKSIRLRQIAAGFLVRETLEGEKLAPHHFEDAPKLSALGDILDSLGGAQVLIWADFEPTYEKIWKVCQTSGYTTAFIRGGQSAMEREAALADFKSGSVQALIANPQAGGTGLNMQEAKYAVYYTHSFSLGAYEQSKARNYRGGSERHESVTHYHLTCKDTVEEVIMQSLLNKKNMADALLTWIGEKHAKRN